MLKLSYHGTTMPEPSITGGTKRPRARNKAARELHKAYPESEFCTSACTDDRIPYVIP